MFLAIVKSVTIPLEIAFDPEFAFEPSFVAFSVFVDIVFAIDILFNFRCTYINEHGEEVKNLKKIARKYFFGRFWLDFVTVLPLKYMFEDRSEFKMIGMLKVTRVLRIADLINYLNIHEYVKLNLKLIQ